MTSRPRIVVISVAALSHSLTEEHAALTEQLPLAFKPLQPVFPAVTCTAQATMRTGTGPERHGMICNGLFERRLCTTEFWNQSAHLVSGPRIWDDFRRAGGTVGTLFWQQSLGDAVDLVLSPAPIHKHSGGMIQDCYSQPAELYAELCTRLGRRFNLAHYWGPLASFKATRWIVQATKAVMASSHAPDLLLTYLPHLDYVLQRRGPDDRRSVGKAYEHVVAALRELIAAAHRKKYDVIIAGDYGITPARRVAFPNKRLRDAGFFRVRKVDRRVYPDLFASTAFCLVDHQVAHVYVRDKGQIDDVRQCLEDCDGVADVLDHHAVDHPNSGELILVAAPGAWFAYSWWSDAERPPDYAEHVDIHNKIGFDPCELFFGRLLPPGISLNAAKIRGTHGRADTPVAMATDIELPPDTKTCLALSLALKQKLSNAVA
ncbi:MAG: alkaline phosphatase family protein [Candidatus Pacebacteria bacterium]|nr:alkaline phosphatase family protein [Candidatus Paceibacterota bacterium]